MKTHRGAVALVVLFGALMGLGSCSRGTAVLEGDSEDAPDADILREQLRSDLALTVSYSKIQRGSTPYLRGSVTVTNQGSRSIVGLTGACVWSLRAYRTPDRSGQAVWGPETHPPMCNLILLPFRLEPGESKDWVVVDMQIEELLALLGPGTHYFSLELVFHEPNARSGEYDAGSVELP